MRITEPLRRFTHFSEDAHGSLASSPLMGHFSPSYRRKETLTRSSQAVIGDYNVNSAIYISAISKMRKPALPPGPVHHQLNVFTVQVADFTAAAVSSVVTALPSSRSVELEATSVRPKLHDIIALGQHLHLAHRVVLGFQRVEQQVAHVGHVFRRAGGVDGVLPLCLLIGPRW